MSHFAGASPVERKAPNEPLYGRACRWKGRRQMSHFAARASGPHRQWPSLSLFILKTLTYVKWPRARNGRPILRFCRCFPPIGLVGLKIRGSGFSNTLSYRFSFCSSDFWVDGRLTVPGKASRTKVAYLAPLVHQWGQAKSGSP